MFSNMCINCWQRVIKDVNICFFINCPEIKYQSWATTRVIYLTNYHSSLEVVRVMSKSLLSLIVIWVRTKKNNFDKYFLLNERAEGLKFIDVMEKRFIMTKWKVTQVVMSPILVIHSMFCIELMYLWSIEITLKRIYVRRGSSFSTYSKGLEVTNVLHMKAYFPFDDLNLYSAFLYFTFIKTHLE